MKERKIINKVLVVLLIIFIVFVIVPETENFKLFLNNSVKAGTSVFKTDNGSQIQLDETTGEGYFLKYGGTDKKTSYMIPAKQDGWRYGKSYTYPITTIKEGAFSSEANPELEDLIIPETITTIEEGSLKNLKKLKRLYILSRELKSYSKEFASNISMIKNLEVHYVPSESVKGFVGAIEHAYPLNVESNKIEDKTTITKTIVTTPTKQSNNNSEEFSWSDGNTYKSYPTVVEDEYYAEIIKYGGNAKIYKVPESVRSMDIRIIGSNAFANNKSLEEITLTGKVNKINSNCFKNMTNLKKITLQHSKINNLNWDNSCFSGTDKSKITIWCVKGSRTEEFAKAQGFAYYKNAKQGQGVYKYIGVDDKTTTTKPIVTKEIKANTPKNTSNKGNKTNSNSSKKTSSTYLTLNYSTTDYANYVQFDWYAIGNGNINGYTVEKDGSIVYTENFPQRCNSAKGTYYFNENGYYYLTFGDRSGNSVYVWVNVVTIEHDAPTIEDIKTTTVNNGMSSKISWVAKDSGSGVKSIRLIDKKTNEAVKTIDYDTRWAAKSDEFSIYKNGEYRLVVIDACGNMKTASISVNKVDETAPTISNLSFDKDNKDYKKEVTVTWKAKDNGTGLLGWRISKKYEYNYSLGKFEVDSFQGYYNNAREEEKTASKTLKEEGIYYLYVVDVNRNVSYRRFEVKNIDKAAPTFTKEPKVIYSNNSAIITYSAKDTKSGLKTYKLDGYAGAKNFKNNGTIKEANNQKIEVTKNGTYNLIIKDEAGNALTQSIKIDKIDDTPPKISKITVEKNEGKKVNNLYYIKKDMNITYKIQFDENVTVDANKVSVEGMEIIKNKSISVTRLDSKFYLLTIKGNVLSNSGMSNGKIKIKLLKEFAKDSVGNYMKEDKLIADNIVLDNNAPSVDPKYEIISIEKDKVSATIRDSSGIAKVKWIIRDKDTKEIKKEYTKQIKGIPGVIKGTDNTLTLEKYKGYLIELYVEDTLGNSKTATVKPTTDENSPKIEAKTKKGNNKMILTWSATDNYGVDGYKLVKDDANAGDKSDEYTRFKSFEKQTEEITNDLTESGDWYLYVRDTSKNYSCKKINVQGIDSKEPEVTDIKQETQQNGKSVLLSFKLTDDVSGVKKYNLIKDDDKTVIKESKYDKKYLEKNENIEVNQNGEYTLYVEDSVGKKASEKITIDTIDETVPEIIGNIKTTPEDDVYAKEVTVEWSAKDTGCGLFGWRVSKQHEYNYTTKKYEIGDLQGYYSEPIREEKIASTTLNENGTYYLYVVDKNGNVKAKKFEVNNVDKTVPKFTKVPEVEYFGQYAEIKYEAEDAKSGVKAYKISGLKEYINYTNSDGKETTQTRTGTQRIKVTKNGTYTVYVKDSAGNVANSSVEVSKIDTTPPEIKEITVVKNGGKTVNGINYIKNGSDITFKIKFSEDVTVDSSKVSVDGMKTVNNKSINIKQTDSSSCEITLKGNVLSDGNKTGDVVIDLLKEFAKDTAGNYMKVNKKIDKIILDNEAPVAEASYLSIDNLTDQVSAKITDKSLISKKQWKVLDVDTKAVVKEIMNEKINKALIKAEDNILTLKKYKGYIVTLYVEDILGNSTTIEIKPPVSAKYEFVKREDNKLTYRITMNLKANLDLAKSKPENLKKYLSESAKNYKILSLEKEEKDTTGRKFILTLETDGTSQNGVLNIPKGTIYVYDSGNNKEVPIEILIDNTPPEILTENIPENKVQKINLTAKFTDKDSGLSKYKYIIRKNKNNKQIETENIMKKIDSSEFNFEKEINDNCSVGIIVWDKQGNITTKNITIGNIDNTPPTIYPLKYSDEDESGNVTVTISANEEIFAEGWTKSNLYALALEKTFKETELRGTNLNIPDVIVKDEAGNTAVVKIEDKIPPKMVGDVKIKDNLNDTKKAEIEFNEEIQENREIQVMGWTLSEDKKHLTKSGIKYNEEIYVKDLAGNTIKSPAYIIVDEDEEGSMMTMIAAFKNEVVEVDVTHAREIKDVELLDLETKYDATYTLSQDKKTVTIRFNTKEQANDLRFIVIEPDGRKTYKTIMLIYRMLADDDNIPALINVVENIEYGDDSFTYSFGKGSINSYEGILDYDHGILELVEAKAENDNWEVSVDSDKIKAVTKDGQDETLKLNLKFRFKEIGELINTEIAVNNIKVGLSSGQTAEVESVFKEVDNSKYVNENELSVSEKVGYESGIIDESSVKYALENTGNQEEQYFENNDEDEKEETNSTLDTQKTNRGNFNNDGNDTIKYENGVYQISDTDLYASVSEYYSENKNTYSDDVNNSEDNSNENNIEKNDEENNEENEKSEDKNNLEKFISDISGESKENNILAKIIIFGLIGIGIVTVAVVSVIVILKKKIKK